MQRIFKNQGNDTCLVSEAPDESWTEINKEQYELIIESRKVLLETQIPQKVTMRQARLALLNAGILSAVNSAITSMAGIQGEAARIEWDYSNEVLRSQPLTLALAASLGMTSQQMDALFVEAAKL